MSRSRPQPGLTARMAVAGLLLAGVYVVFIALLVAAGVEAIAITVIVVMVLLAHHFATERLMLHSLRARVVREAEAPQLHAAMSRVCVAAALPLPRLAVVASPLPDACTVGRVPSAATVCVTTALLELLDAAQLEAVLAHELSHVARRDVAVMTATGVFAALAAALLRADGERAWGRRPGPAGPRRPGGVVVVVCGLVHLISFGLSQALSRHRERVADRDAVALSGGDPAPLAGALSAIDARSAALSADERGLACGELGAFSIVAADVPTTVASLCATHPPLRERLHALAELPVRRSR